MSFHFPSWCCCCCLCNFADWYEKTKNRRKKLERFSWITLTSDKRGRENLWQLENFSLLHHRILEFSDPSKQKETFSKFFLITKNFSQTFELSTIPRNSPWNQRLFRRCQIHYPSLSNFNLPKTRCWLLIKQKTLQHKFSLDRHVDKFIDFHYFLLLFSPKNNFHWENFCREIFPERTFVRHTRATFTDTNEFIIIFTRNKLHKNFLLWKGKKIK